jgi:hypothetical protein
MSVINWTDTVTPLNAANMNALEQVVRKGQANGYVGLDASSNIALAAAQQIVWAGDVNLYRSAQDILKSDDAIQAGYEVSARTGSAYQATLGYYNGFAGLGLGNPLDTYLYRAAAGVVKFVSAIATSSYGTSLPASPVDGQEYTLVDSITNPSYQWRFRYNGSSVSTYKWEFVGGGPMIGYSGGDVTNGGATSTWVNIVSSGITVPRAGEYRCSFSCLTSGPNPCTNYAAPYVNSLPGGVFGPSVSVGISAAGGYTALLVLVSYRYTFAASASVAIAGQSNAINGHFSNVTWEIIPIRVQ